AETYQWFPHCVQRYWTVDGISKSTTMFLPPEQRAVLEKIELRNVSGQRGNFAISFNLRGAVTKKTDAWFVNLPGEGDNQLAWDASHGRITFAAQHSPAACAQGIHPPADSVVAGNVLEYRLALAAGETREFHFVAAIGGNAADAAAMHDRLQ